MAETGAALLVFSGIVAISLSLWAFVDLLQWSDAQWRRAEHDRLLWGVLVFFVLVAGPIAYATAVRPRLLRPEARIRHTAPGWYPDPRRAGRHRYHDGRAWTRFVVESR